MWCYSCGWLLLLEPLKHSGYQKAQDDVERDNLEKSVCLLLVHETFQLASCTLENVPLDGAGLYIELWNCVLCAGESVSSHIPSKGWKENIQKTPFKKCFIFRRERSSQSTLCGSVDAVELGSAPKLFGRTIRGGGSKQCEEPPFSCRYSSLTRVEGTGHRGLTAASQEPDNHGQCFQSFQEKRKQRQKTTGWMEPICVPTCIH